LRFQFLQKNAAVTTNQDQAFARKTQNVMQQTNAAAITNQDQLFALQKQTLMRQTNVLATTSQKQQQKAATIAAASHVADAAVMAAIDNLSI
jgi:hypothetical protein